MKIRWSIRWVSPAVLGVLCLLQWSYYFYTTSQKLEEDIEQTNKQHVTQIMHRGQTRLEAQMQLGQTQFIEKYIADFGSDANITTALLLSSESEILGSLRSWQKGLRLNQLLSEEEFVHLKPIFERRKEVRASLEPYITLDEDRCRIVGIIPVQYQSSKEILRPDRVGLFVLVRNIETQKTHASGMIQWQFFQLALIMLVVIGAAIYLLHVLVGKKVNRLLAVTKAFADGNYSVRYGPTSQDEIGSIGGAFDSMAESVEIAHLQLVKSDEELRRKTDELNRYFDSSLDLLCVADTDGYFRRLNKEWERTLGYPISELEGQSIFALMHPDDLAATREAVCKLSNQQSVINFVNRYRCKDGSYRWLEWRSYPEGKNIYAVARDITERKKAESALRESEQRLKTIMDTIDVGMMIVDADTHQIVDVNPAAVNMFGASKDAVLGKICHDFICPAEKGKCPITDLGEHLDKTERILLTAGKTEVPVLKTVTTIMLDGRKHLMESFLDISERISLEEQLRQKQKMEAIGQLAGGIAHDYNNQLTPIMGFSEMLIDRLDDPRLRSYAQNILRAATRSRDLTQQLLDFSRKGKFLHQPMNVHQIISDVVSMLEHSIDKRILIKQRLEANPPTIMGDPTQIQNAILNLALNARDAMPNGGELVFHTTIEDIQEKACPVCSGIMTTGKYLRVDITDTGAGVPDCAREHLFEPFFTTKKVGEGTGLGLASVYGTVRSHQGHVVYESTPGNGATFTMYLPAIPEKTEDEKPPRPIAAAHANILLVDDEEQIISLVKTMAEKLDSQIVARPNGKEALDYYRQHWQSIDLVILDMMMPVMGGKETFREMKKINPKIKALLSSGYSLANEAGEMLEEGILDFIQKPFIFSEFSEKIQKAMNVAPNEGKGNAH